MDKRISDTKQIFYRASYSDSLLSTLLSETELNQSEEQEIQIAISKNNPSILVAKTVDQHSKISCHLCSPQKEIVVKKFFYTFENGQVAFFCSEEEKHIWMTTHLKKDKR